MKGINLLDGIIVSKATFEELVLMKDYIRYCGISLDFSKWKNSLSEDERYKNYLNHIQQ